MKKLLLLLFSCNILVSISHESHASVVTYALNGGRFGDNLYSYSKAKWLSYIYDINFYYQPFLYSDQLSLSAKEKKYTQTIANHYKNVIMLPSYQTPIIDPTMDCVYINQWYTKTTIDWNDQRFVEELKKDIAPLHKIKTVAPPSHCVSIALHIRTGGTYASDANAIARCPLRFIPLEFYIEQLKHIADALSGQFIYVYIFTDDSNPKGIARKCAAALRNEHITFDYRSVHNSHNANVLEDFFSMMKFDYLIRPGSHFSRFVERLGKNKVVIYPSHARKVKDQHIIDEVTIKRRKASGAWRKQVFSLPLHKKMLPIMVELCN